MMYRILNVKAPDFEPLHVSRDYLGSTLLCTNASLTYPQFTRADVIRSELTLVVAVVSRNLLSKVF